MTYFANLAAQVNTVFLFVTMKVCIRAAFATDIDMEPIGRFIPGSKPPRNVSHGQIQAIQSQHPLHRTVVTNKYNLGLCVLALARFAAS